MSELSGVVYRMNRRGPRTEPCGTPLYSCGSKRQITQVSGHDLDDASAVLTEKEREER